MPREKESGSQPNGCVKMETRARKTYLIGTILQQPATTVLDKLLGFYTV